MALISDFTRAALTKVGVVPIGEPIAAVHETLALQELNSVLSEWSVEGLLLPYSVTQSLSTVNGTASYTWGASGNINTRRPVELTDAVITVSTGVFEQLLVTNNLYRYREYTSLPSGRPCEVYYNPTYPQGTVTFYPTPDAVYPVSLIATVSPIPVLSSDTSLLPPEYDSALALETAVRLLNTFSMDSPLLVKQAKAAKEALLTNNSKRHIRLSKFDRALLNYGGGNLNSVLTGV